MSKVKNEYPTCPFCDNADVTYIGRPTDKCGPARRRWVCIECSLTFDTDKDMNDAFEYRIVDKKLEDDWTSHLPLEEWKPRAIKHFEKKVKSALTALKNAGKRYELLTKDKKYKAILDEIDKMQKE